MSDHGIAVAELARELYLARNATPVLEGILRDHPGVIRRAAGDDHDLVDATQVVLGESHLVEV